MSVKKISPYTSLLYRAKEALRKQKFLRRIIMWTYPKDKLKQEVGWDLNNLYQRVQAAQQLGYDVMLVAEESGMVVYYQEKQPEIPYEFRY